MNLQLSDEKRIFFYTNVVKKARKFKINPCGLKLILINLFVKDIVTGLLLPASPTAEAGQGVASLRPSVPISLSSRLL